MTLTLTPPTLVSISRQIANGNSVRGILIANEYLRSEEPLRLALVMKAENCALPHVLSHAAWNKIKNGARYSELSIEEQSILSFESTIKIQIRFVVPSFCNRRKKRSLRADSLQRPVLRSRRRVVNS